MSEKIKFTHMETGKTYEFDSNKERDKFIIGGCKEDEGTGAAIEVNDVAVINVRLMSRKLGSTVGALRDSLQEVLKIAVDAEEKNEVLFELLFAKQALDEAFMYMTDKSYKGNAIR